MSLNNDELAELVVRSFFSEKLTKQEAEKMLKALWEKYWGQGLESFSEKVVFSSHILFPNSKKKRENYTKEVFARLRGNNQKTS